MFLLYISKAVPKVDDTLYTMMCAVFLVLTFTAEIIFVMQWSRCNSLNAPAHEEAAVVQLRRSPVHDAEGVDGCNFIFAVKEHSDGLGHCRERKNL
eukprot:7374574-Ditylum_brightwellii.AAC.1